MLLCLLRWKICPPQNRGETTTVCNDSKSQILLVLSVSVLRKLVTQDQLKCMGHEVFDKYRHIFEPIPHADKLPADIYCWIQLKDAPKSIVTWSYSSPWKYCEAWQMLLQHHEDTGQICPSNSSSASPSFKLKYSAWFVPPTMCQWYPGWLP